MYDDAIDDAENDKSMEEETVKDVVEEEREDTVDSDTIVEDVFYVRSSQGVSINSVNFCRGKYRLGQLVSTMIIDEDIRDNILSLDAQSIRTNPHLAM